MKRICCKSTVHYGIFAGAELAIFTSFVAGTVEGSSSCTFYAPAILFDLNFSRPLAESHYAENSTADAMLQNKEKGQHVNREGRHLRRVCSYK